MLKNRVLNLLSNPDSVPEDQFDIRNDRRASSTSRNILDNRSTAVFIAKNKDTRNSKLINNKLKFRRIILKEDPRKDEETKRFKDIIKTELF